jgi:hypothetical protein
MGHNHFHLYFLPPMAHPYQIHFPILIVPINQIYSFFFTTQYQSYNSSSFGLKSFNFFFPTIIIHQFFYNLNNNTNTYEKFIPFISIEKKSNKQYLGFYSNHIIVAQENLMFSLENLFVFTINTNKKNNNNSNQKCNKLGLIMNIFSTHWT